MEDKAPIEIPILIVIATIGIIVFIFFVVLFVLFYQKKAIQNKALQEEKEKNHQRQLVKTTIEVSELERKRIAANLHDDIGGMINLLKHNINKIARQTKDELAMKDLNMESAALLEATMENVRNISRDLAPPVLMRMGFVEGLQELCQYINKAGQLKIEFAEAKEPLQIISKNEVQLYRIISEVINNVIKHAEASKMSLELSNAENKLIVEIKHNGKGISSDMINVLTEESKGIGLKSIKSRAHFINAKLEYKILSPVQSIITIKTPLYETN